MKDFEKREVWAVVGVLVTVVIASLIAYTSTSIAPPILTMWLAGAAALGLVIGFTTGASETAGAASSMIGFISGGVLVPVLGGIAALVKQPETTKETSTYLEDHVVTKVVEVTAQLPATELHPLWVAGSFFAVFSLAAILGIGLGVRRRVGAIGNAGAPIKLQP